MTVDCGGLRRPGDFSDAGGSGDGVRDFGDQLNLFGHLFNGDFSPPCDGDINSEANRAALDVNGDGQTDMSDGVYNLIDIFLGGPDPGPNLQQAQLLPGLGPVLVDAHRRAEVEVKAEQPYTGEPAAVRRLQILAVNQGHTAGQNEHGDTDQPSRKATRH